MERIFTMQNIDIKYARNKYRITWNNGNESFTFETHDKKHFPLWQGATLSLRNLIKETLPSAQFKNDYIERYYPGITNIMKTLIDEYNRPLTQLAKIREDIEGLRKEEDRIMHEMRTLKKAKPPGTDMQLKRLEKKQEDIKARAREKGKKEQEIMEDVRTGKINGMTTKPLVAPPLPKPREITYPVRMEFAMDQADQDNLILNCEKCGAICLKPNPMPTSDKATFLCPLCFRKQINNMRH